MANAFTHPSGAWGLMQFSSSLRFSSGEEWVLFVNNLCCSCVV